MPSADPRKDFVLTASANFFGIDKQNIDANDHTCLNAFLDDGNCSVLTTFLMVSNGSKKLVFSNFLESQPSHSLCLVFYKASPTAVTAENIQSNIYVSSLSKSPVTTLYHTLHNVFVPSILKDKNSQLDVDDKLERLIKELETGLGHYLRKNGVKLSKINDGSADENSLGAIFSPEDEFQLWTDISKSSSSSRKRAAYFLNIFRRGKYIIILCFVECLNCQILIIFYEPECQGEI